MSDVSLNERLFWPAVAVAVLALGGFGYFAATKMFRAVPVHVADARTPVRSVAPSVVPSEAQTRAALETVPDSPPASDSAESAIAEAAPMAKAEEMEDAPYMLPDHAPMISRDTFKKPLPPPKAPAKRPPTPPAKTPAQPKTVAAAKAPPGTAAKLAAPKLDTPAIPLIPAPRYPTYVLNDGRKIPAAKVVDMGEFWGLKTTGGQIVTIKKEDVKSIER